MSRVCVRPGSVLHCPHCKRPIGRAGARVVVCVEPEADVTQAQPTVIFCHKCRIGVAITVHGVPSKAAPTRTAD
jgi:hypothetical protein